MTDDAFRAALLSEPRAPLTEGALPVPVRALLAELSEAQSTELRQVRVGGVSYFELLSTWEHLDEDAAKPTFVAGVIVDGTGAELADLDFEQRLAIFAPSKAELARNTKLTAFMEKCFTEERLLGTALITNKIPVPTKLEPEDDARAYKVEFDGRSYFAKVLGKKGALEVLIYDAAFQGLGGSALVGKEPFDVAEVEVTRPLPAKPAPALGKAQSAADDFEAPAARKFTI